MNEAACLLIIEEDELTSFSLVKRRVQTPEIDSLEYLAKKIENHYSKILLIVRNRQTHL